MRMLLVVLLLLLPGRLPGQMMLSWTGTGSCCSCQLAACDARAPAAQRLSFYAWLEKQEGIMGEPQRCSEHVLLMLWHNSVNSRRLPAAQGNTIDQGGVDRWCQGPGLAADRWSVPADKPEGSRQQSLKQVISNHEANTTQCVAFCCNRQGFAMSVCVTMHWPTTLNSARLHDSTLLTAF